MLAIVVQLRAYCTAVCISARYGRLYKSTLLLQMSTASGRTGLNGQVVHSDVMSVKELELVSV